MVYLAVNLRLARRGAVEGRSLASHSAAVPCDHGALGIELNHVATQHTHDPRGDVGGTVGNTLKLVRNQEQPDGPMAGGSITSDDTPDRSAHLRPQVQRLRYEWQYLTIY